MSKEKLRPWGDEIQEAEKIMTKEEKKSSKERNEALKEELIQKFAEYLIDQDSGISFDRTLRSFNLNKIHGIAREIMKEAKERVEEWQGKSFPAGGV